MIVDNYDDLRTNVYIPILDDPISYDEVKRQIKRLKSNKAGGPDGIPPGLFRMLPFAWILCIVTLFNNVFMYAIYPVSWINAKLFTVFKKGSRLLVKNYRAINVINAIAKLYDMVLCVRLSAWFSPFREQAGAQSGRGCLEHIITLRLLIDLARRKKYKLFVTFVDFQQAYDKVPRYMLFRILKRLGCGSVMLFAIISMYRITKSIIVKHITPL